MIGLALAAPCVASAPLDAGQTAACDGVLISAARARRAVADAREVELRRQHECPAVPACPEPPTVDSHVTVATASFFTGFVLGLLLFLAR